MDDIVRYDIWEVRNPFDRDFTATWDSQPYIVPAKGRILLPSFVAKHVAGKIIDRLIQDEKGIKSVFNQTIRKRYLAKVLFETSQKGADDNRTESQRIKDQVKELNSQEEQPQPVVKESEDAIDGFEGVNDVQEDDIPSEEELKREAMEESNPKGARAEELSAMEYSDLQTIAKDYEIPANRKAEDLVELIVEHEFKS